MTSSPNLPPADDSPDLDANPVPPQTLDEVWRRFGDQLRRRARTRLRQYGLSGQAESMDICNEVLTELIRRGPLSGDAKEDVRDDKTAPHPNVEDLMGYILKAIDNQVLDTFRTLARQCRDFRRNDASPIDEMPLQANQSTPSQVAIRTEVMQRVRSLLDTEDARAVDMMLENRDWKEIGSAFGIEPDAARMRVKRAIDRVRDQLVTYPESIRGQRDV